MQITDALKTKEMKEVTYRAKRGGTADTAFAKIGIVPQPVQEEGATASFSSQGLGMIKKQEDSPKERERAEKQMYQEMLENADEAAKAQEKGFGDLAKALEIARRILDGDIVPLQDEQFLMEFNSEIYMKVKSMAKLKEDPREYDALTEEEDEEQGAAKKGASAPEESESAQVQASAAVCADGGAARET